MITAEGNKTDQLSGIPEIAIECGFLECGYVNIEN